MSADFFQLNGTKTLSENIADNGGLKSAFHAYEEFARIKGEEDRMPGVNFTHRQLFFIAFAQVFRRSGFEMHSG